MKQLYDSLTLYLISPKFSGIQIEKCQFNVFFWLLGNTYFWYFLAIFWYFI